MHCKHCGKEMKNDMSFCPFCGGEVENKQEYCPACGCEVDGDMLFCPECGYEFAVQNMSREEQFKRAKKFDVVIYSGNKEKIMKLVGESLKLDEHFSRKVAENLPAVVYMSLSYEDAMVKVDELKKLGIESGLNPVGAPIPREKTNADTNTASSKKSARTKAKKKKTDSSKPSIKLWLCMIAAAVGVVTLLYLIKGIFG